MFSAVNVSNRVTWSCFICIKRNDFYAVSRLSIRSLRRRFIHGYLSSHMWFIAHLWRIQRFKDTGPIHRCEIKFNYSSSILTASDRDARRWDLLSQEGTLLGNRMHRERKNNSAKLLVSLIFNLKRAREILSLWKAK